MYDLETAMALSDIVTCSWRLFMGDVGCPDVNLRLFRHVRSGSVRWRAAGVRLACDAPNPCYFGSERLLSSVDHGRKETTCDGG